MESCALRPCKEELKIHGNISGLISQTTLPKLPVKSSEKNCDFLQELGKELPHAENFRKSHLSARKTRQERAVYQ